MRKRARLIYNPSSGQELIKRSVADILHVLEKIGYEASAYQTTPAPFSAQEEAKRAAQSNFDLVLAAGGDGTMHEVVNGIAPLNKRPQLAFIPAGTTNDYARAIKIPIGDPVAATQIIAKKQHLKLDIGLAYPKKYFINIAATGSLSELTYNVSSSMKTRFGYLAYIAKTVELFPHAKLRLVRVTHDQGVFEGKVFLVFVALTNSIGSRENIAPDAKLDDGYFTLILVKTAKLLNLLGLMTQVLVNGQHVNNPHIIYLKTRYLKIEPLDHQPLPLNLDGEYGGDAPVELEVLPHHLDCFVNMDEINQKVLTALNSQHEQ